MQSDKFIVLPGEAEAALDRVERLASCYSFPSKEVLQIRLLAEEIISVVGPTFSLSPGRCWVSTDKDAFSLSIDCDAGVRGLDKDTKKRLLKISTVKRGGILGMLGRALEYLNSDDIDTASLTGHSLFYSGGGMGGGYAYVWNPVIPQSAAYPLQPSTPKNDEEAKEELELKIIEGIADGIKVSIQHGQTGPRLEVTVLKKFAPEQVSGIEF